MRLENLHEELDLHQLRVGLISSGSCTLQSLLIEAPNFLAASKAGADCQQVLYATENCSLGDVRKLYNCEFGCQFVTDLSRSVAQAALSRRPSCRHIGMT